MLSSFSFQGPFQSACLPVPTHTQLVHSEICFSIRGSINPRSKNIVQRVKEPPKTPFYSASSYRSRELVRPRRPRDGGLLLCRGLSVFRTCASRVLSEKKNNLGQDVVALWHQNNQSLCTDYIHGMYALGSIFITLAVFYPETFLTINNPPCTVVGTPYDHGNKSCTA